MTFADKTFPKSENKLSNSQARIKMIVTDGVFSMDGDMAKLDEICNLAEKYDALVMVDDCHSTGFVGKTLRSICLLYTSPSPRDKRQSRMPSSA